MLDPSGPPLKLAYVKFKRGYFSTLLKQVILRVVPNLCIGIQNSMAVGDALRTSQLQKIKIFRSSQSSRSFDQVRYVILRLQ